VWLLNEMTSDERHSHELDKRICRACGRSERRRLDRRISTVIWNSRVPTHFPPRRFVGAKIRVIEEVWSCEACPKANRPGDSAVGLLMDFEHVGAPGEIVPGEQEGQQGRRGGLKDADTSQAGPADYP